MPTEDRAHVGAGEHLGQQVLVGELDGLGRPQHRQRDRRVVHRQDRAVRGGHGQLLGQPHQLRRRQVAVVVARHAGVERDHPQPVDVVHPVLRRLGVGVLAEEPPRIGLPLVVVAHHPHHLSAHLGRGRLDELAQPRVRRRLGAVGQVAGEDQRLGRGAHPAQPLEGEHQAGLGIHDVVLQRATG